MEIREDDFLDYVSFNETLKSGHFQLIYSIVKRDIANKSGAGCNKKNERLLYTLYHEIGHVKKANKLGFLFVYTRIGDRVFFMKNSKLQTTLLDNNSNSKNPGCAIVFQPPEILSKTAYKEVILAGAGNNERFFRNETVSNGLAKRINKLYPQPYNPTNSKFNKRSKIPGTDAWLHKKIDNDTDLYKKLNDVYSRVYEYLSLEGNLSGVDLGFLEPEKDNIVYASRNHIEAESLISE